MPACYGEGHTTGKTKHHIASNTLAQAPTKGHMLHIVNAMTLYTLV